MKYERWYDKDARLKGVFEFIQGLDLPIQNEMAKDIVQILMKELEHKIDLDKMLSDINNCNYDFKRWYDKNPDLYSSFEMIKNLPDELRIEAVKRIIESALLMYFGSSKNE